MNAWGPYLVALLVVGGWAAMVALIRGVVIWRRELTASVGRMACSVSRGPDARYPMRGTRAEWPVESGRHQHHAQHTVRLQDGTAVAFICACGHDWPNEAYLREGVER